MPEPERSIFRESAIKRYQQRQEQGILLRVSYPPALVFFWIFLPLLLAAGGFTWWIQVPIQVQGQGVVVEQGIEGRVGAEVVAILFFSPSQLASLHVGQPAVVSIGSMPIHVYGSVAHLNTVIISPNEARNHFNLQGGLAQIITGPSITVTISIAAPAQVYVGSLCSAQIQTGSQSVFSLLPGFKQLFGK